MDSLQIILTSAVVAAVIGPIASFIAQRRLAERQAKLDYESATRRRLYDAVGPLRFQLLMAARDVVRRMGDHHLRQWRMWPDGYYVTSFVYRVLRPLAIGDLVEKQTNFADFSLDPDALLLLRFQTASYRMLTGDDPVADHPAVDWLVKLFGDCESNLTENPIFWTRLVAYGYVGSWLLQEVGTQLGFAARPLPVTEMLNATRDQHTTAGASGAVERFLAVVEEPI